MGSLTWVKINCNYFILAVVQCNNCYSLLQCNIIVPALLLVSTHPPPPQGGRGPPGLVLIHIAEHRIPTDQLEQHLCYRMRRTMDCPERSYRETFPLYIYNTGVILYGEELWKEYMQRRIEKLNWWHSAIIDWMLENPDLQLGDCADYFRKSRGWISVVIHSAAFVDLLEQRKLMHSHMVSMTITEKLEGIAHQSAESLEKAMKQQEDAELMSVGCARDTLEMSLKALGYTARSPGAININAPGGTVQFGTATPEALARARENMKNVQYATQGNLIEGDTEEATLPSPT